MNSQFEEMFMGKHVRCRTLKRAKDFLAKAHENGYKWPEGLSLLANPKWDYFHGRSCYFLYPDHTIGCSDMAGKTIKPIIVSYRIQK